jgi:hypothetical protein
MERGKLLLLALLGVFVIGVKEYNGNIGRKEVVQSQTIATIATIATQDKKTAGFLRFLLMA